MTTYSTKYEFQLKTGERAIVEADSFEEAATAVFDELGVKLLSSVKIEPEAPPKPSNVINFADSVARLKSQGKVKVR